MLAMLLALLGGVGFAAAAGGGSKEVDAKVSAPAKDKSPNPAGKKDKDKNDKDIVPEDPVDEPVVPEDPVEPVVPDEPVEDPVVPEDPVEPVVPDEPVEDPVVPEDPVEPVDEHKDDTADKADHDDHDGSHGLPTTPEEIAAFVEQVRAGTELHVHGDDSPKLMEHMQVLDLVSPAEATHIAIGHGSWFDPNNWHNGEVPGDDAKVIIPENVWMEYDGESEARLFTVRVDGQLDFAVDVDSKMVVDTFVVSPSGTLIAGTKEDPIDDGVTVDIVIANNGAIDTDWDPGLLSRGLISHGHTEIHGQIKDSHEKVIEDPMAGDTSVTFADLPEGWEVGDKIVIAGTHYEGYRYDNATKGKLYHEPEDEVRYISKIEGNTVHFDEPLEHDHDTPRADLHTSVANYSRNVTVRSEDGDDSEVFERGHVMMMHSDEVDIRYAAFEELGRTDKSAELFGDNGETDSDIAFDSNVSGRYGLHLHRTGIDDQDNPTILEGNAVYGSPGWGIVHHDSHAILENNATYDTFGAGYVAETGNETGSWVDNIAIDAQGIDWGGAKGLNEPGSLNFGVSGDGFWFTGRMVDASDNIAASVNHGFIYFHRASGKLTYDADVFELPELLNFDEAAQTKETPILVFEDNEAFASRMGLHVIKSSPVQGHDVHSIIDGFTAWSVESGVGLQYTSHYLLNDLDLIGKDGTGSLSDPGAGIGAGKNLFDITITNSTITGFEQGINLGKSWSDNLNAAADDTHSYTVINTDLTGNTIAIGNLTAEDTVHDGPLEAMDQPFLTLDPLFYKEGRYDGGRTLEITGEKTDSLGTHDFPNGPDRFELDKFDVVNLLEENGYYTAEDGTDYMVMNIYFSDGLTGDVFVDAELVEFEDSVLSGQYSAYDNAKFNGNITMDELIDMTDDAPVLVRDASAAEARTVDDFEEHASLMHDMDGETVMAMLSNGETLSETVPMDMISDEAFHQDHMDML